jgi:hypothetical protein
MPARWRTIRGFIAVIIALGTLTLSASAFAAPDGRGPKYTAGAEGAGDPYFPFAGNGGYDVQHYNLDITYALLNPESDPPTGQLEGVATLRRKTLTGSTWTCATWMSVRSRSMASR